MRIAWADEMRAIDRRASEEFGIPLRDLMERAGQALFDTVQTLLPPFGKLGVLCGKGNNGGDGFVLARRAAERKIEVTCLVAAPRGGLRGLPEAVAKDALAEGVPLIYADEPQWAARLADLGSFDVVADCLLGTGATGEPSGPVAEALQALQTSRRAPKVVAADVPSGIDCDTGAAAGMAVRADATVTFGLPKPFLFLREGVRYSGRWHVADLGFPQALLEGPARARLLGPAEARLPSRARDANKGDTGHVLIVAGCARMRGAAVLAARAALRAGAGLVSVASIPSVLDAVAHHLPEALLLPLPERDGVIAPEAASIVRESDRRYDAGLFGPGLSTHPLVLELLSNVFGIWERPALVDADALNAVAKGVSLPNAPCVLTPHPGELARMMNTTAQEVQADRFGAARAAQERTGRTVLLKGAHTVVASPGLPLAVNQAGNPGMATGGMGDVLSGLIATLLAQDLSPHEAATTGMLWHGLAADHCAQHVGSIGYTASEVADALPRTGDILKRTCAS